MRPDRHLIQRQVIEVETAGVEGPELQNALARSYWERAVPELEQLFDRMVGPDECLRLDRLEIDLGLLAGRDWESRFRNRLIEELTRVLSDLRGAREDRTAAPAGGPRSAVPLQQFLYFLVNGRLPWWGPRPQRGWTDVVAPTMDAAGWGELLRVLRTDARARIRCVDSLTDHFLEEAVALWLRLEQAAHVCALLAPPTAQTNVLAAWRRQFWGVLLERAAAGAPGATGGPALLRDLLALRRSFGAPRVVSSRAPGRPPGGETPESPAGRAPDESTRDADLPPELDWQALPEPWREWARDAAQPAPSESAPRSGSQFGSPPGKPAPIADSSRNVDARRSDGTRQVTKPAAPGAGADPIYLRGAGAILLHPFLETLFRERGLLTGREFTDAGARDHAIHLIGLMSFGEPAAEYDLLLAKLLCGCSVEDPVEPVDLDEKDRAACDELLGAVLRHWSVLRSNSPQWLRDQFLVRDGKLEPVDSGWRLTVECRAQDVLLARLPWGFGVVCTPWLGEKIFVQWVD